MIFFPPLFFPILWSVMPFSPHSVHLFSLFLQNRIALALLAFRCMVREAEPTRGDVGTSGMSHLAGLCSFECLVVSTAVHFSLGLWLFPNFPSLHFVPFVYLLTGLADHTPSFLFFLVTFCPVWPSIAFTPACSHLFFLPD